MKLLFLLTVAAVTVLAQDPVAYKLSFPNAVHHEAEVRVVFAGVRNPVLDVRMSRSSPGRYALHEFAKSVYNVRATDEQGKLLTIVRPDPYTWRVSGHHGTVALSYTLFGDRADGTYAAIDSSHAHLNAPATFAWAREFQSSPVRVQIDVPDDSKWKVATQLKQEDDKTWSAPNLSRLMDAPIEISAFTLSEWTTDNHRFRVALHHNGTTDEAAAFAKMCEAIVTEEEGIFGAFPDYDAGFYTFLADYLPYVNGDGMEHRDSTVISSTRPLSTGASANAGTAAHEFFHSWNVKRIRPRSLQPFDFERANMSGELWFAEGFTNYYGVLTMKRAGLSSMNRFLDSMGGALSTVLTSPGRTFFSAVEMSEQAPFVDAATANDPVPFPNTFISYYTYGQALAFGLDLMIRERFPGKSLDDWMRAIWRKHPDDSKPYDLAGLEKTLAETTGDAAFASDFFRRHVYGKEALPFADLLKAAGMRLQLTQPEKLWLGISKADYIDNAVVLTGPTLKGSPLYEAGLDRGDKVLDADGKTFASEKELNAWLAAHKSGDRVKFSVERRTGKQRIDIVLGRAPSLQIKTFEDLGERVEPSALAFRNAWLGSKALRPLPKLTRHCSSCLRTFAAEFEFCPYDGKELKITADRPTVQ